VSHKTNVKLADETDARLQYLSWRVWGMKRRHATVQLQRAQVCLGAGGVACAGRCG
jgi:hypothetical protein